ncbi:MAG: SCO family protein [Acidimicrobiia bacterium]|nr:SCO family protein [Acidimicrobiia bacterium]
MHHRVARSTRVATGVLLVSAVLVACGEGGPHVPAGLVRTPAPYVGALSLPESTAGGADFAFRAEPGHLLLLYFGYTACPDICPTTLADLRSALRRLGETGASRVEVAFATIDPGRDTDPVMTAYIRAFFADGHGLRTDDPDRLFEATYPLGVSYDVWTNADGYVEVMHSAWVYVIDDQGLLQLMWPFGTAPDDIAADLEYLLGSWTMPESRVPGVGIAVWT